MVLNFPILLSASLAPAHSIIFIPEMKTCWTALLSCFSLAFKWDMNLPLSHAPWCSHEYVPKAMHTQKGISSQVVQVNANPPCLQRHNKLFQLCLSWGIPATCSQYFTETESHIHTDTEKSHPWKTAVTLVIRKCHLWQTCLKFSKSSRSILLLLSEPLRNTVTNPG